VLTLSSVVDLGAIAAHWNVRHAREVGGRGVELDVHYFGGLGGAGVVALAELEQRPIASTLRCEVSRQRRRQVAWLTERQADWRGWRWRDARRLQSVEQLVGESPMSTRDAARLICPMDAPPTPAPLTPPAKP
jgi:hypothetical protein